MNIYTYIYIYIYTCICIHKGENLRRARRRRSSVVFMGLKRAVFDLSIHVPREYSEMYDCISKVVSHIWKHVMCHVTHMTASHILRYSVQHQGKHSHPQWGARELRESADSLRRSHESCHTHRSVCCSVLQRAMKSARTQRSRRSPLQIIRLQT